MKTFFYTLALIVLLSPIKVHDSTIDLKSTHTEWVKTVNHNIHPRATLTDAVPIERQVELVIGYHDGVSKNDVLWLARTALSETKDLDEAYHIMWIIRNRVETNYRNKNTYKDVVLDPYQFSTFNPTTNKDQLRRKNFYMNLDFDDQYSKWDEYLKMAAVVITLSDIWNPHDNTTRHFVHQAALTNIPNWIKDEPDVTINTLSIYTGI